MFLGSRKWRNSLASERGSTIIPVIGLVAVSLIIVALVVSSLTKTLTYGNAIRADVQSQAAAQSGVNAAKNMILRHECDNLAPFIEEVGPPAYRATVWRNIGANTWIPGCPVTGTTQVKIISHGYSQNNGIAGVDFGDDAIVESIFNYSVGGPVQSGPALLTYQGASFANYTVTPNTEYRGDVVIPTGNFSCSNFSEIDGSVIVMAGSITMNGSCHVSGSVWAKTSVALNDQASVGLDVKSGTSTVSIASDVHVYGSVEAKGSLTNLGVVDGDAISGASVSSGVASRIGRDVKSGTGSVLKGRVGGNVSVNGALSIYQSSALISGNVAVTTIGTGFKYYAATITTGTTAQTKLKTDNIVIGTIGTSPTPQTPNVSFSYDGIGWIHYVYDSAEWQASGFTRVIIWPTTDCTLSNSIGQGSSTADLYWRELETTTTRTLVDVTACSSFSGNLDLDISTDIAFVGSKYNLSTLNISSADGNPHRFWILVPDGPSGSSAGPDCQGNQDHIYVSNSVIFDELITAMAYCPCTINVPNSTVWRGQILTGGLNAANPQQTILYSAMGLPGIDLTSGQPLTRYRLALDLSTSRNRLNDGN